MKLDKNRLYKRNVFFLLENVSINLNIRHGHQHLEEALYFDNKVSLLKRLCKVYVSALFTGGLFSKEK